jgi:methionine-S-sulfoxide reductase
MIKMKLQVITLGMGCFWCTEAVFHRVKGVIRATCGYMGGHVKNPAYREVCTGNTGHAEVAEIEYDSTVISTEEILTVFFAMHDPTTLNKQGADTGTQYRSVIFYHDADQHSCAEKLIAELNRSGEYSAPIVTQVNQATDFYKAEIDHQEYYRLNPEAPYCRFVIRPKMLKLESLLKKQENHS